MTQGLERRYGQGHHHFVTVSCYHRQPHFHSSESRQVFERCLEAIRQKYGFTIDAYVVMPEHVHLLVSEPSQGDLSVVMQALKVSVSRKMKARPFWQRRFYDFNVFSDAKRIEKRRYIHRNPSRANWSRTLRIGSAQATVIGQPASRERCRSLRPGPTRSNSKRRRRRHPANPHLKERDVGHPTLRRVYNRTQTVEMSAIRLDERLLFAFESELAFK